ncbi:gasdermin-A isoform X2 [Nyctibius grandis]|uniref:gasdermin-A isoform X2 n=1 Tax=Nyctibius grandis TaxID=48427 RepID=UPI0035BC36A3
MFRKVTQSIANQMDDDDLVPVRSLLDHEHFQALCLVRRKRKAIFHPSPCYRQTWYKLDDVLLPGEDNKSTESLCPTGDGEESKQFAINKSVSDRVDGSLNLCIEPTSVELDGAVAFYKGLSIKMEKKHIPLKKIEALTRERKMNVNHSFIQQIQKTDQNLYVVHETLEASEKTSYEESTKAAGSFMTKLYAKFFAKGTREKKQSVTIPKGCTLAFKAIELAIKDGSWYSSGGKLGALEVEVEENCQILSKLSSDLVIIFLKAIKAVMRDRNLFEELTEKMEAVLDETGSCELKTESPDLKDLLSSLQSSPGHLLPQLAGAITYTLDALDELTEDQLLLLLESLEDKIVSQQLKLVKTILEYDIEYSKRPFRVDAGLLSFSQEKEQKVTIAMVEMSGVKLQKDGFAVRVTEAFSAVAALYVSLYVLNLLSNSD